MGKYANAMAKTGLGAPGPGACPTDDVIPYLLELTADPDPKVRRLALKHLCPCRLQRDREAVWDRLFQMTVDPDPGVRRDVIHAMTDGSPRALATRVEAALEDLRNDPDPTVRKYVRRTRSAMRASGRVNVHSSKEARRLRGREAIPPRSRPRHARRRRRRRPGGVQFTARDPG